MSDALSVFVTGGASGIGAATARKIVACGGHAVIADLDADLAQSLAGELGPRAVALQLDVLDEGAFAKALGEIGGKVPALNGLVNCAGIPQVPRAIEDWPTERWAVVMDSHVRGTYIACRLVGGEFAKRGLGAIVNCSSVVAFRPGNLLAYAPAKAAVANLTQILAVQWALQGVRVNAVAPGFTDTPFLRPKDRKGVRDMTPILDATPMRRLLRPEEIAEVIHFLLSPAASAVTGATVPCDGGYIAGSGWTAFGGVPR